MANQNNKNNNNINNNDTNNNTNNNSNNNNNNNNTDFTYLLISLIWSLFLYIKNTSKNWKKWNTSKNKKLVHFTLLNH